jgi:type II secretory pathway pseudopilin PulG
MAARPGEDIRADDIAELAKYREVAELRARFGLWRGLALIVLIYLVNVLFNAVDLVIHSGLGAVVSRPGVTQAFLIDGLVSVGKQLPTLLGSILGFVFVAALLAVTARVRHVRRTRSFRSQLTEFRRAQMEDRRAKRPETEIDTADIERWVDDDVHNDAAQRSAKLEQIKEWFKYDELLVEWTALEISRRRFAKDVRASVFAAVGGVAIVRVILLAI